MKYMILVLIIYYAGESVKVTTIHGYKEDQCEEAGRLWTNKNSGKPFTPNYHYVCLPSP